MSTDLTPQQSAPVEHDALSPLPNAAEMALFAELMSDDNRLQIINALSRAEQSVIQLEQELPHTSQSNISRHLDRMKQAGIVAMRKDGKYSIWSLTETYHAKVAELANMFGGFGGLTPDQTMDRLKQNVEV